MDESFTSGFVSLLGRPNVGKSTLLNALSKRSVSGASAVPQTTRDNILAVITTSQTQIAFYDTPGIHRPRSLLGRALNERAKEAAGFADIVCFCLPADESIGSGDLSIAQLLSALPPRVQRFAIVTKIDTISSGKLMQKLLEVQELLDFAEIIPVSAAKKDNLDRLLGVLAKSLPAGPKLYPDDNYTSNSDVQVVEQEVRRVCLGYLAAELPYSVAVRVRPDLSQAPGHYYCEVLVERNSQKPIVIGKNAQMIKRIRQTATRNLRALLEEKVTLTLNVVVEKNWQNDPKKLSDLGYA